MSSPEERLIALGLLLPEAPKAVGSYLQWKRDGDHLHLSGHGPIRDDGTLVTGKVGADIDVDSAYEAAKLTALLMIATMKDALGSLDEVKSIVRVFGMVNCAPGFNNTPTVINGASELFVEVFGPEVGAHTRSAVGMAELPFDIAVELEAIVRVK